MLSDHEEFDLNQDDHGSLVNFPLDADMQYSAYGDEDECTLADMQHFSQPLLRSRPAIDFSGRQSTISNAFRMPPTNGSVRQSTVGSDFDYSATLFSQPRSQVPGSTLHSSLKPEPLFPHKVPLFDGSRLPPALIAALTITQLYHNRHYRELRQKYDDVSATLAAYVGRDLVQSQVSNNNSVAPAIYQAIVPHTGSGASSLGPSDSASQQTRFDPVMEAADLVAKAAKKAAIERLMELVEPPPLRPDLPKSVLWDFEDCLAEGIIITEANRRRPKMHLAIRRGDGTNISQGEFDIIRRAAIAISKRLIATISLDPRSTVFANNPRTKATLKKFFEPEYNSAILTLEAHSDLSKILRLCSAHWKADQMIGQTFLRKVEMDAKAPTPAPPFSLPSSNTLGLPSKPCAASIPAPSNAPKRALELSPGPKSPSAVHTQKRSKDNSIVPGKRSMGPPTRSDQNQHPAPRPVARKITPSFLSRTDNLVAEPTPARLSPVYIEPSADNLVATIKSQFPSLTNAPHLLASMNVQSSFKQGNPSDQVVMLLERLQFADPGSPDIDEDNSCQSWGHDQFTGGGISPSSSLTTWQDVGNVATAFKLVAAALKTCQEARLMCVNAGAAKTNGFISDVYLEQILDNIEKCWVDAGGMLSSPSRMPVVPSTPTRVPVVPSTPARVPVVPSTPTRVPVVPSTPTRVPVVPSTPTRVPVVPSTPARVPVIPPSPGHMPPSSPTSYCAVAKSSVSPQARGLKVVFRRPTPIPGVLAATQTSAPTESKPATGAEPMQESQELSAGSEEDARARVDALSLKSLQVPELQALFGDIEPNVPKPKRKDDLIAAIVGSPGFASISQTTIQGIIETRKLKKGLPKQQAASK